MRPWWNPMPAFASPQFRVSVPVRPPRWMNCSASATETSSMLPERLMRLLPAHQRDEAFQRLQLAIGIRIDARSEQRRGGMRRDQIEELVSLVPEHALAAKQLEDAQGAHRRALHLQRHAGEGLRAVDGPDAQHSVGKRRIPRWISTAVDPVRIEPGLVVLHALGERDLTFARAVPGVVLPEQEHELLGAEQVDGDLGDGRLHLARIERGMELVGRHVEVHQPPDLLLVLRQLGGQLVAIRLHVGEARGQIAGCWRPRLDLPGQLRRAIDRGAQLVERGPDTRRELLGSGHAGVQATGLAVSRVMTPRKSPFRQGLLTYARWPA